MASSNLFYLQWHITGQCPLHCKHCYMYDSKTYLSELKNELSLSDCIQILDDFNNFIQKNKKHGLIAFSGGDIFLREQFFWTLAERSRSHGISFSVLGNPDLLTREKAFRLRHLGIKSYQISLDGLEGTHDRMRRPGSFKKSVWALCLLANVGIKTSVMFTLSRANCDELIPVMCLVGRIGVNNFGFDRVSAVGEGEKFKDEPLSPMEYREICNTYLEERKNLRKQGVLTDYSLKSHLFKLLFYEEGKLDIDLDSGQDYGCPAGRSGIAILADGNVLACRRIPISVGKLPEQSIEEILTNSELITHFRQRLNYEKCKDCELYNYCRGCPAVAYGMTGNPFDPDPQCWKELSVSK